MSNSPDYKFKRKRYGYGWIPASPVAWLALAIYLVLAIGTGILLLKDVPRNTYQAEVGIFLALMFVYTMVLILITRKYGPSAKWRWGKKDSDNPGEDF